MARWTKNWSAVVVQVVALLLLLLVLVCSSSSTVHAARHVSAGSKNPSVIIVGAGISGIMAAKTLSENGITDFLILEATERIGGRIRNTNFSELFVELGANWVEGVGGDEVNPIWTLANKYSLQTFYSDFDNLSSNFYDQEGKHISSTLVDSRMELQNACVNFSEALSDAIRENDEEDISILAAQRMCGLVPTSPLDMAIDFNNYDYESGEPPRTTSLKNVVPHPTFETFGEDYYLVADQRGYAHIVHELAKEFLHYDGEHLKDLRIKFNTVVNSIEYSSEDVVLTTEDGSTYKASYAILSASLGVLQSDLITFKPDLPYWKLKTIFQFDMADYTKIFLKFPYKFWPTGPGTEFFFYADGKRGYYPAWQHLEGEYPGSNVLFVTITDDESRRVEQQSDEKTKEEAMAVLRKIFGNDIPEAESILVPRWFLNRFFRGTFTNWPIGVTSPDFQNMKAPIGKLYFTGEHTSERFNGYVHGAYYAGIESAQSLLDCINNNICVEITDNGSPLEKAKEALVSKI